MDLPDAKRTTDPRVMKKTLLERINKYRLPPSYTRTHLDFDYQKALGEERYNEIKSILAQQAMEMYKKKKKLLREAKTWN